MSVQITWGRSDDAVTFLIERGVTAGGPWSSVAAIQNVVPGPNWNGTAFFYDDAAGTAGSYYRVISVASDGVHSPPSAPFRAAVDLLPAPPLVNGFSIPVGNVAYLQTMGFTTIEIWRSLDRGGNWAELTSVGHRLELDGTVSIYSFFDTDSNRVSWYRWRFSKNGQVPFSQFSGHITGKVQALVNPDALSVGVAYFTGLDGRPVKRSAVFSVENSPAKSGPYVVGEDTPVVVESDETGFLQVPLLRGMTVSMSLEGTSVTRTFVVPNSPTFDLFGVGSEVPDRFTVQSLPPRLNRRTLS